MKILFGLKKTKSTSDLNDDFFDHIQLSTATCYIYMKVDL